MKFINNDVINGPCSKPVCNLYERPLTRNIKCAGGGWQEVVTEQFEMFGNYTKWNGSVEFILVQITSKNMNATGEYSIAGFQDLGGEYSDAPSSSVAPSAAPTNLEEEHIAYIVRYAGEVRTVINYPFQVDKTGEVLAMDGSRDYELCEVDEVEGRKAEVSDGNLHAVFFLTSTW
jgi:hypothetical protein